MTEAVQVLTDSAVGHFQIPEGVILTEQATKKYRFVISLILSWITHFFSQKLDRFLKVLADFGSMTNVNGEERAKGFFSAPSKLFYNDFFSVRKLVKGVLQFAVERFQNKPAQVSWTNQIAWTIFTVNSGEQSVQTNAAKNKVNLSIWNWLSNGSSLNHLQSYLKTVDFFLTYDEYLGTLL